MDQFILIAPSPEPSEVGKLVAIKSAKLAKPGRNFLRLGHTCGCVDYIIIGGPLLLGRDNNNNQSLLSEYNSFGTIQ
jgi:hypothetical protein